MTSDLEQLSGDPNQALPAAVESIDPERLRARLEELHREHRRALDDANALLRSMGGDPVLDGEPIAEAAAIRNAGWPRLMCVQSAAAYVDEKSVDTFRRAVGTGLYPRPIKVPGKGERWLKETLDQAIDKLRGKDDGRTALRQSSEATHELAALHDGQAA